MVAEEGASHHTHSIYAQSRFPYVHECRAVRRFIDHVLRLQHLNDMGGLQTVIDVSSAPYVAANRLWLSPSPADLSQRGARPPPPAGAICTLDEAIHHSCCSAQFEVLLRTAAGSAEQLYMNTSGNESHWNLPTASQPERLKGINESIPAAEPTVFHLLHMCRTAAREQH